MIKDYYKTTCPCCGQPLELFVSENGSIGIKYYDIEDQAEILEVLKEGNRMNIANLIKNRGADTVKDVAILNLKDLTQGVVSYLEDMLHTQFVVDER